MKRDILQEQLKSIFSNVNEWLKFAEAKNAVIIAANAAAALAAFTLIFDKKDSLYIWFFIYLSFFAFFAVCTVATALISVIPKTKISFSIPSEKPNEKDNLLFYGHIAKYQPLEYLTMLKKRLDITDSTVTGLDLDYAQQIVINSQITLRKHDIFRVSSWLAITAVVTPIIALPLFIFLDKKEKKLSNDSQDEN